MSPHEEKTGLPVEVLVRFARGDRAAFLEVYRAHQGKVRRWVGRFFRSPFEQDEAQQEVWLHVHRVTGSFDVNQGAAGPWLRAVTANRCRELLRARGREPDATVPLDDLGQAEWLDAPGPEEAAVRSRLAEAVAAFARTLDDTERAVLQHGLVDELSHEALAAKLGVNVRRSKYLKKKLLERAAADPTLAAVARDVLGGGR
jgi:RNA polymerase sigma-70 factor, ECF subfamily